MIITAILMIVLLLADQVSKYFIDKAPDLKSYQYYFRIPKCLKIVKTYNPGAAWGMGAGSTWVLVIISFIAMIVLGYFCIKNDWKHAKLKSIAMTMAFAGCVGNLIDRVLTVCGIREGVVDMLDIRPFNKFMNLFGVSDSICNVADVFLVVGLIWICIDMIFFHDKRVKKYGLED